MIKLGKIKLESGEVLDTIAIFNEGYSHIAIDDHCYIIINGEDGEAKISSHIFEEAMEELRKLPNNTSKFKP